MARAARSMPRERVQPLPARPTGGERGFALAVSIFALTIIAALITGVFFAARQEMKIGENSLTAQRAFHAADAGINDAIANWKVLEWNFLFNGDSAAFVGALPSGTGTWTGVIRRLSEQMFFVRVTGTDGAKQSTRTIGALSRLLNLQLGLKGAITTRGELDVSGNSKISGKNTNPPNWSCPAANDTLAAIAAPDTSKVDISGSANITGAVKQDTTINDSTFLKYGEGLNYDDLVRMATITYPGSTGPNIDIDPVGTDTSCNLTLWNNWGEPNAPPTSPSIKGCRNYYPIIHITGDLKVTGGRGQGILLVDGNVEINGNLQFYGPVISKGTFTLTGTQGHVWGGVLAANLSLSTADVFGNVQVTYSSCALIKAMQANSPGRWLRQRSWVDLF